MPGMIILYCSLFAIFIADLAYSRPYKLFSNQKTAYRISLANDASESEKWAATELQHWLQQISGTHFPIKDIDPTYKGRQIVIGYNELTKSAPGDHVRPSDEDESFRYYNVKSNLYIYGGKQRGTMYGVMAFLENEFGCRWYTPTVSVIPKRSNYFFHSIEFSDAPRIRNRHNNYLEASDPLWAARNRMNGRQRYVKQPGGVEAFWEVHTFYQLLPPAEFFATHPEYFSLVKGKRMYKEQTVREPGQLCLSNPDVLQIITERVKDKMRRSPEYTIYDVSQNDIWGNQCECGSCQEIVQRYGGESGLVIWFVNQVATAVKAEFPDKFIGTLAYRYTRKPPRNISPEPNVVVRLCPIEACVAHSLTTCVHNQPFLADLKGWSAIALHLFIWDYVTNFEAYFLPYPNFNVLQPNLQTFQQNKAIGVMEQGNYQDRGGEFAELRTYLISRLLWNPASDTKEIINDFMNGYYGRSGAIVKRYFDLLQGQVNADTHMHIGLKADNPLFSDEFVRESIVLFETALSMADNEEIRRRIALASVPVLYIKCKRQPKLARSDGTYDSFLKIIRQEGITRYAEYGETPASFAEFIRKAD